MIDRIVIIIMSIAPLFIFYFFNKLLETEYSRNHIQVLPVGRPLSFFERLLGSKWSPSNIHNNNSLFYKWLFNTPSWATEDKTIMKNFWRFRISILIWFIAVIVWAIKVRGF